MDERLSFVARCLEGDAMSDVYREFGISRRTGYKLLTRYEEEGPVALFNRSPCLMRVAVRLQKLGLRAVLDWLRAFAPEAGEIECGRVRTAHEPHQVRSRQQKVLVIETHVPDSQLDNAHHGTPT